MKKATKETRSLSISDAADNDENESPLRAYLNQMGDMQRESMSKLLDSTVDASCLPSCEHDFGNQLDLLMHCHQPLSFLQFFEHHDGMYEGCDGGVEPSMGAYVAPRSCEYCGASTTTLCPASCTRPKLYFRKQKPPFASPENWDPVTEYELPPAEEPLPPPEPTKRSSSWVSELFGAKSS